MREEMEAAADASWPEPPERLGSGPDAARQFLAWWWRLTCPPEPTSHASLAARESMRIGRLASTILFGVMLLSALSLPSTLHTPLLTLSGVFAVGMSGCALAANRKGLVRVAAALAITAVDVSLIAGVWFLPAQKLDLIWLFVAPVMIAVALLPPLAVFPLVLGQCLFVLLDFMLQPNTEEYVAIRVNSNYIVLLAPILGQIFIALVSYLLVSGMTSALERADHAEELAELRQREATRNYEEADRQRELQQGMAQMQAVLTQLAKGNFHARVRPLRDAQLWQLGITLNHFIGRLARMGQSEFALTRTDEESRRLADAIYVMRSGRQPIWPGATGTPLDRVIEALTATMSRSVADLMAEDSGTAHTSDAHDGASDGQPSAERKATRRATVTGSLLPVTGSLIARTGMVSRQAGVPERISPPNSLAPERPKRFGQLALPAPSRQTPSTFTPPPWATRRPTAPASGAGRRQAEPHAKRTFPTVPTLNIPAMPTAGGLPTLRAPEMFATSGGADAAPPVSPTPRRPPNSLPRVRLERGALDQAAPAGSHA
ncbi:MAG: hypothetical protein ACRDHE_17760 [Ktedonobacterales bacterium]